MDAWPPALLRARDDVDRALARYLDGALGRLAALHGELEPVAEELRRFVLGGGKRLRPLFATAGYRAAGRADVERVQGPALALELLHTCALLHDDIIDDAPTRRGRPTVHEAFRFAHHRRGLQGDPVAFGRAAAILLGDLAFVQADEAFLTTADQLPTPRLLAALRVFTLLREEVMAGQYLDVLASHQGEADADLALAVASYKSGRYTVARPLQLGATLAGADEALATALYEAGLPLGRAFQLRDDLLGVFGAERETGKPVASDLSEGKRTLLVAETLTRLSGEDRRRFDACFGRPDLDATEADELRRLMRDSGAAEAVEQRIEAELRTALERFEPLELDPEGRRWIEALAGFVASRRR